jgi:hypothetical protein
MSAASTARTISFIGVGRPRLTGVRTRTSAFITDNHRFQL